MTVPRVRRSDEPVDQEAARVETELMMQRCVASTTHRVDHTGTKQLVFTCPYPGCDLESVRRKDALAHIRVHTDHRPYCCDDCGHTFKTQNALRRHTKRMHQSA